MPYFRRHKNEWKKKILLVVVILLIGARFIGIDVAVTNSTVKDTQTTEASEKRR